MNDVQEAKKKAIIQTLKNIAETGQPTSNQIIFLEFLLRDIETKEKK